MLTNEKYKGDALLQKTYTIDFLNKKRADNNGQVPQYYVEDSHPAIIDKEMWEAVQLEMERRRNYALQYGIQKLEYATADNPFAGRVICGACGKVFGRKVWNSTDDRFRRIIWRCNGKYVEKGERGCDSRHIDDKVLYQVFVEVFNMMVENKDCFLDKWKEMWESDSSLQRYKTKQFAKSIAERGRIKEFDVELYFALVEKVVVHGEGRLMVVMLDGTEVECATE
jgi:site-specific DNA recombinase